MSKRNIQFLLLQIAMEESLAAIERLLGPNYKLTLVARYTPQDGSDADILLTVDDLELAIATINKMKERPPE